MGWPHPGRRRKFNAQRQVHLDMLNKELSKKKQQKSANILEKPQADFKLHEQLDWRHYSQHPQKKVRVKLLHDCR